MGIIIRKKATGEIFDVMPGFKLELRNTSPIFNELGSKTISTSLPKTPNNIKLLGFSNRLDILKKPELKIPVVVSSGSYVRVGVLYESSAYNSDKTFGITIAFNEGIMYEAMSDIPLNKLSGLPIIEKSVDELIEDMNALLKTDDPDKELSVFTAYLKGIQYTEDETEVFSHEKLNLLTFADGNLIARTTTEIIHEGKRVSIDVPLGYGITPFVRVWKILELIFRHFGYKMGDNPFKTHYQLRRLCLANNICDAIVGGVLAYEQLLPDVTVTQFLQSLYTRYGMKVSFNSNTNTVNLFLIRDVFRNEKTIPVSLAELPDIDYTSPKQVKLTASKNLDRSETYTDTYEEFLTKYNNTIGTYPYFSGQVDVGGVYFDRRTGLFYHISTNNREEKLLSSIHFDWNKQNEGLEVEEIVSEDECITMINANGTIVPYLGVEGLLMNVILTIDGTDIASENKRIFSFVYDMGEAYSESDGVKNYRGFNYGSIFPLQYGSPDKLQEDRNGNVFNYSLTFVGEYGAFNQFFKEYDAFLRHSNHTVKLESFNSVYNLSNIDFRQKRIVDNHPLLLDKFDHDLDGHWGQMCKIEARTLRLYEPYDLNKEQALPVSEDIRYKWVLFANQDLMIEEKSQAIVKEIEDRGNNYRNVKLIEWSIRDDPDPPSDHTYWFLPPSEYQYQKQIQTGSRTHTCKVRYFFTYEYNMGSMFNPDWQLQTGIQEPNVNYKSWFEPEGLE